VLTLDVEMKGFELGLELGLELVTDYFQKFTSLKTNSVSNVFTVYNNCNDCKSQLSTCLNSILQ